MTKLKKYHDHQKEKQPARISESSGVACTEINCPGEMMKQVPYEEHYSHGRLGETGAIKSGMVRAICNVCGWRGWV